MTGGKHSAEYDSATEHQDESTRFDIVSEATAEATAGATTDIHDDQAYGARDSLRPDLARGESD
jgi:hypothetical protein